MIRLYVFLLDFLIPFLCDPDLQCMCLHLNHISLSHLHWVTCHSNYAACHSYYVGYISSKLCIRKLNFISTKVCRLHLIRTRLRSSQKRQFVRNNSKDGLKKKKGKYYVEKMGSEVAELTNLGQKIVFCPSG